MKNQNNIVMTQNSDELKRRFLQELQSGDAQGYLLSRKRCHRWFTKIH